MIQRTKHLVHHRLPLKVQRRDNVLPLESEIIPFLIRRINEGIVFDNKNLIIYNGVAGRDNIIYNVVEDTSLILLDCY